MLAEARPGQESRAHAGTSQQVSSEMQASMAGVQMNPIPCKSGPAAMSDLTGGQVMLFTADFAVTVPQHEAGKSRGLAATSIKLAAASELPPVNEESGLKDCELIACFAVFAPAGTAPDGRTPSAAILGRSVEGHAPDLP